MQYAKMRERKKKLKDQIDFFEFFKEKYFKIMNDLKFNSNKDYEARNYLSNILKQKEENNNYDLDEILRGFKLALQSMENIMIYGCGPSLESSIEWIIKSHGISFFESTFNIAADGAARFLKEKKIPINSIFTDLDGITRDEFNYAEYIIVHCHGDNSKMLEFFKQDILNFINVIGTIQVEPLDNLVNPGGFTDGDRILYFLRSLLVPVHKIFLIGMDFKNIIGKYSKPFFTSNQESNSIKTQKLDIAVKLIEQIIPKIQNKIYFVNTHFISNNFQYLSLGDFMRIL